MTTSLWNCITLNSVSKLEAVRMHSLISSPRTSADLFCYRQTSIIVKNVVEKPSSSSIKQTTFPSSKLPLASSAITSRPPSYTSFESRYTTRALIPSLHDLLPSTVKVSIEGEIVSASLAKNELKASVSLSPFPFELSPRRSLNLLSRTAPNTQAPWSQASRRRSNSSTLDTFETFSLLLLLLLYRQSSLLHSRSLVEGSTS